jgi:hypothetical protein
MDSFDSLFSDTPAQPAPAPSPEPAVDNTPEPAQPAPVQAAVTPVETSDSFDELFNDKPAPTTAAPAAPATPQASGFFAGLGRGFVSSLGGTPADVARGTQTLLQLSQMVTP